MTGVRSFSVPLSTNMNLPRWLQWNEEKDAVLADDSLLNEDNREDTPSSTDPVETSLERAPDGEYLAPDAKPHLVSGETHAASPTFAPELAVHVETKENRDASGLNNITGFAFNSPKKEGKGEDADPVMVWQAPRGLICVFDGMGGAGSTTYRFRGDAYSGAYIASRTVAGEIQRLFSQAFPWPPFPLDTLDIGERLGEVLQREAVLLESEVEPSRLKSKLIRRLPTTMASLFMELSGGEVACQAFWAGDSRCYALSPMMGLQQLTLDDLKVGGDALDNLKGDSPLSNCLNADGDFELRSQTWTLPLPLVLLAATDGCFGYLYSPAHFEFLLLDTLLAARDMIQWRDALKTRLQTIAGDDCSICLLALGWPSLPEMQTAFAKRHQMLRREFIEPLDELSDTISQDDALLRQVEERKTDAEKRREALRQQLWLRYKETHDHLLAPPAGHVVSEGGSINP